MFIRHRRSSSPDEERSSPSLSGALDATVHAVSTHETFVEVTTALVQVAIVAKIQELEHFLGGTEDFQLEFGGAF